ncbi:MAG TPA: dihydrofolate reductase family protein [Anaerolineales bacterium]|nr:dihydrofolate reductase family protein [Anaerolineales bacterium]
MRKIIYSLSVSLDGFVEDAEKSLDWVHIDDEIHTFFNDQSRGLDAFLYGRTMYELMSAYWPTADANPSAHPVEVDFSQIWKRVPKLVFSDTLDHVEWNSRLLRRDDLAETVKTLKAESGNDLGVGGPTLAGALIQLGLVDEFHLMVNPVVLGHGTPYFPLLDHKIPLQLVETRSFSGGVIFLRYERVNEAITPDQT